MPPTTSERVNRRRTLSPSEGNEEAVHEAGRQGGTSYVFSIMAFANSLIERGLL